MREIGVNLSTSLLGQFITTSNEVIVDCVFPIKWKSEYGFTVADILQSYIKQSTFFMSTVSDYSGSTTPLDAEALDFSIIDPCDNFDFRATIDSILYDVDINTVSFKEST